MKMWGLLVSMVMASSLSAGALDLRTLFDAEGENARALVAELKSRPTQEGISRICQEVADACVCVEAARVFAESPLTGWTVVSREEEGSDVNYALTRDLSVDEGVATCTVRLNLLNEDSTRRLLSFGALEVECRG